MDDELTKIARLLQNQSDDVKLMARAIVARMIYKHRTFEMSMPGPIILGDQRNPERSQPNIGRRESDRGAF